MCSLCSLAAISEALPLDLAGKVSKNRFSVSGFSRSLWVEMNERHQDFELLQRFTREGEQSAFADVVRRHLDLVFATALRKVADPGAAQEIAQNVFAVLARKAWQFAPDDSLSAWLHKATLLESKSWLRGELGRRRREETAAELGTTMKTLESEPAFQMLVPLLDEALLSLREKDRTALLLRFYESHSLREVGTAVGVSEDAARMRVQSALEKLAEFFKRRGFKTATVAAAAAALQHTATSVSATVVSAVVSAALQVAPPALAGLGALLARLASLSRVQTAAVCVALAAGPAAWQLNARQAASANVRQLQAQRFAGQTEERDLLAEVKRVRAQAAILEQSVSQRNEAEARTAAAAQAFDAWKRRTRSQLLAADHRWDDNSPFARIPKLILPRLSEEGGPEPFSPPGVVLPYARELMGLTAAERQAVETILQRHLSGASAAVQETNEPVSGREIARKRFVLVLSGSVEEANRRTDQMLAEVRDILGAERWPLVQVRLSQRRAGGVYSSSLRNILIPEAAAQQLEVWVEPDEKGPLRWYASGGNGGMSGNWSGALSEYLPDGDTAKTPTSDLGAWVLFSDAVRQRVTNWLQEEAIARLGKKESP